MAATTSACRRITDRRHVHILTWLCAGIYFSSYVTRINYKAVIAEIVSSEGITRESASIALTGLFITYGIGQLISGWLGDRVKPKVLIFWGLITASVMNILMPLSLNPAWNLTVWCMNGLGQAMMWPPIVKTLTGFLSGDDYMNASVKVSWGSCFGTVLIYLTAPLFINLTGWRGIFAFSAVIGVIAAFVSYIMLTRLEKYAAEYGEDKTAAAAAGKTVKASSALPAGFAGILCLILLTIVLQGSLRDGVDTWMPSYISDVFSLGTSVSILTGVVLPLFTIICYQAATFIYTKCFTDEMSSSCFFFALTAVFSAALYLLSGIPAIAETAFGPILSVICFMLIVGCMHAVNLILTTFIPRRFSGRSNISTISGTLNFATYVGSALSTYGFAALSDRIGWGGTIVSWIIIAAAGGAVCIAACRPWRRFLKKLD